MKPDTVEPKIDQTGDQPHFLRLRTIDATGHSSKAVRFVTVPFGQYEISVGIDEIGRFVGIAEVRIKTDATDYRHKLLFGGSSMDIDDWYKGK